LKQWVEHIEKTQKNKEKNLGMNDALEKIKEILGLASTAREDLRTDIEKIPWDHTFLLSAIPFSNRSHDAQTQNGAVIVRDKTILSTGYNGFMRDINDTALPNQRPFKYDFMIHAEHNAILNCVRNGIKTKNATAYITSEPCNYCLQYMWQAGIKRIVYSDFVINNMLNNKKHKQVQQAILHLINLEICFIPSCKIK
jgi:dCMP deaminase